MLLMLSQRKLIVPEHSLVLEDLLEYQKKEEAIHTLISIDRVRGLMETIALRKKFLRHLEKQKKVPAIMVDNEVVQQSSASYTPLSPHHLNTNSVYDLTSEDESGDEDHVKSMLAVSSEESAVVEDNPSHTIWQDMLYDEAWKP
ncbi:hypothetical protein CU097_002295 [Rhizopus azygosporus]|uniref:Uncharacterized protein n=1 Tax=Rhizopus azygosporus TaxID=86630 RepID=A0A367J8D1_RHIAZ|nr:hypothetical protein CU097_002295 [Rhizopus azygosporus]